MARKRKAKAVEHNAGPNDHDGDEATEQPDDKVTIQDDDTDGDNATTGVKVGRSTIPYNDKSILCERRGGFQIPSLIFTHGAGGGLTAPAASDFADAFSMTLPIMSFQGNMNLPSRVKYFHAAMDHENFDAALGGRSMGARAAAIAATQQDRQTKALVLVSFPLVGGKKNDSREQELLDLPYTVDVLFISGDKDTQCDLQQLERVMKKMKARSWLVTVEGAEHGMSWTPKSSVQQMRHLTGVVAAEWLQDRDSERRRYSVSWDAENEGTQTTGWIANPTQHDDEAETASLDEKPPAKKRKRGKT